MFVRPVVSPREKQGSIRRRDWLKYFGAAGGGLLIGDKLASAAVLPQEKSSQTIPSFTGPGANPYWNSVGPIVSEPQKAPLMLLADRPVQLETPRHYFLTPFTPNEAFYVRWHLDGIPNTVDLKEWRLRVEGNVAKPLALSLGELMSKFRVETIAAVNQCSGNSRSRLQPRVPGGQWGNGAMGNALWSGVRLRDVLNAAGIKSGSVQVQFQGLEDGQGPEGNGSHTFQKSLDMTNPVADECLIAYAMNGEPLPMLNGFPVRLVVPGYFATYWMKCLTWIRVLNKADDNFWMKTAYRIPDTPRGNTTPAEIKAGTVKTIPIERMPVRSFLISPDGGSKIPAGMSVTLRGVAFSGYGRVTKVEVSDDGAKNWHAAHLGEDLGAYSFRTWDFPWTPRAAGRFTIALRATDEKGNVQPDEAVWNAGGYLWNRIERQEFVVGAAA
ncbi:MAG: molybdopterin-dependent oxidoreductase [Candidatus Acidiferrum sp.]